MFDHGEHKYTLRQFLLMQELHRGGEWTDVCAKVTRELASHVDWDCEAENTYANWRTWYKWNKVPA